MRKKLGIEAKSKVKVYIRRSSRSGAGEAIACGRRVHHGYRMDKQSAIEYRPTSEYLHAIVIGPRTPEFASRFFHEIPEKCAELGCRGVLIETRLEGEPMDASVVFHLLRQLIAAIKGYRTPISAVAIVAPYADTPSLAEVASANRAVRIAGFTEISAAEHWLLSVVAGDPGAKGSGT